MQRLNNSWDVASFSEMFRRARSKPPNSANRKALYDPPGWGRFVCPLFATDDHDVEGCGTAFFVKGFDWAITAEHLVDVSSVAVAQRKHPELSTIDLSASPYGLTAILPSRSVVFGTVSITQKYVQSVLRYGFDLNEKDDPFAELAGNESYARRSDVMVLEFESAAPLPPDQWRPRLSHRVPEVGDVVCAVGFPDIRTVITTRDRLTIQNEGMAISFGEVIEVCMSGRGRYETTPVVFVESDWPAGMSGGPVLNSSGRVLGVVSRELPAEDGLPSRGSFTLLARM